MVAEAASCGCFVEVVSWLNACPALARTREEAIIVNLSVLFMLILMASLL
jgi:hypothetical protein